MLCEVAELRSYCQIVCYETSGNDEDGGLEVEGSVDSAGEFRYHSRCMR
jgi:hypothetical protein